MLVKCNGMEWPYDLWAYDLWTYDLLAHITIHTLRPFRNHETSARSYHYSEFQGKFKSIKMSNPHWNEQTFSLQLSDSVIFGHTRSGCSQDLRQKRAVEWYPFFCECRTKPGTCFLDNARNNWLLRIWWWN